MPQDEFQSTPRSALVALKSATQHEHDALDAALDLLHPSLGSAGYRRHLEAFFGFYAPMELALAAIGGWSEQDIDLTVRDKSALLRADLISLAVDAPDALPQCQALPFLPNFSAALGCLYVLEGATLGGQLISRHVEKQFGYTASHGARFFNGYGERTGEMWMTFRRSVNAYGDEPAIQDQMIAGALATFVTFREWCGQRALA